MAKKNSTNRRKKNNDSKLKRKSNRNPNHQGRQIIDSLDGDFSDDVGSVFENTNNNNNNNNNGGINTNTGNNYEEGEYINPQKQQQQQKQQQHNFAKIPLKSLKNRFNYAAQICAASVRDVNKEARGSQSILYESKDQYLLNKCHANKFVVINLCEEILIDTIVLANFEFFSSTFKDFRVYVANNYPTNDWKLLGQWKARNTRDLQVFKVQDRIGWFEYIKIEFLTHYGHEYYCPLSLVRVHGMPEMEYYYAVEREGLASENSIEVIDEKHLWPADVREEIIHPQIVTNTSEWFPTKVDNFIEEEEIDPTNKNSEDDIFIHPSFNISLDTMDSILINDPSSSLPTDNTNSSEDTIQEDNNTHGTNEEKENITNLDNDQNSNNDNYVDGSVENPTESTIMETHGDHQYETSSTITSDTSRISSTTEKDKEEKEVEVGDNSKDNSQQLTISADDSLESIASSSTLEDSPSASSSTRFTPTDTIDTISTTEILTADTLTESNENIKTATAIATATVSVTSTASINIEDNNNNNNNNNNRPKPTIPINKEPTTQESIYKIIMKRINALEINATLSQRYLDEQNNMLNDVFLEMEKRQQEQLIMILNKLNETASHRIDNIKRRYERSYGELKEQMESDLRDMSTQISILTDQISFERKISMMQLIVVISLFVFLALSRGTLNTLSPVMVAQAEERKRRESDGKKKEQQRQQQQDNEKENEKMKKRLLLKRNLHESMSSITSYTKHKLDSTLLSSTTNKIKLDMDGKKQSTLEALKLHFRQQAELLPSFPKPPSMDSTSSSSNLFTEKSLNRKSISLQDISNNNNNNNNNTIVNNNNNNAITTSTTSHHTHEYNNNNDNENDNNKSSLINNDISSTIK
ncbi:unnamed protein product [Cunninghamella echinulata]